MNNNLTFNDLKLPPALLVGLNKMGFQTPTPVQAAAIPVALSGRDVVATAQTGTGKTGAFGIPLLSALYASPGKQALVLAPTRELAAQIFKVFREIGQGMKMRGALVVGGESFGRQRRELSGVIDFIVATPGRLQDHLDERSVQLNRVSYLVIDEVDRMLDMGFLPQIERVLKKVPTTRQTLMFSATLPPEVLKLTHRLVKNPHRVAIGEVGKAVAKIKETEVHATQSTKPDLLLKEVTGREGLILIFTRTKIRAQRVGQLLEQKGHKAVVLHGGKTQSQRKQALSYFRSGSHKIMVATDLAGRGLDVPNIETVINYDLPETKEDYVHRIGRTGRCGNEGNAINFIEKFQSSPQAELSRPQAPRPPSSRNKRGKPGFRDNKRKFVHKTMKRVFKKYRPAGSGSAPHGDGQ